MTSLKLWQRLWLVFAVIWVVVSGLSIATMLAAGEGEPGRAAKLVALTFAVPAAVYLAAWAWSVWRGRRR